MELLQARDPLQAIRRVEHLQEEGVALLGVPLQHQRGAGRAVVKGLSGRKDLLVPVKEAPDGMGHNAKGTQLSLLLVRRRSFLFLLMVAFPAGWKGFDLRGSFSTFRVLKDGHHELHGQPGSDERDARPCDGTLLVQRPILGGLSMRNF